VQTCRRACGWRDRRARGSQASDGPLVMATKRRLGGDPWRQRHRGAKALRRRHISTRRPFVASAAEMRWSDRITACLGAGRLMRLSIRGTLCQPMFLPSPISGTRCGVVRHDPGNTASRRARAAATQKHLNGSDGDLAPVSATASVSAVEFQVRRMGAEVHGPPRAASAP